jgi:hypothetical protein
MDLRGIPHHNFDAPQVRGLARKTKDGPQAHMGTAYESWSVEQFIGNRYFLPTAPSHPRTLPPDKKRLNLGAALNVWNDQPNFVNEVDVSNAIFEPLRVMAQKTWGSPAIYSDFHSFQGAIRTVGEAPPRLLWQIWHEAPREEFLTVRTSLGWP